MNEMESLMAEYRNDNECYAEDVWCNLEYLDSHLLCKIAQRAIALLWLRLYDEKA